MANTGASPPGAVEQALAIFFSWGVLAAISIIISGKLLGSRFALGFVAEDRFRIPLLIFDIRARGDQVSLGSLTFIFSLTVWVCFGGAGAYQFFKRQTGLDIGQWNSLCAIAAVFAMFVSLAIYIVAPLLGRQPVIGQGARDDVISKLKADR
jgi:hypothetical protein